MGKLVILKDSITGESIYPQIPITSTINEDNGSNILGHIESEINNINKSLEQSTTTVQTTIDKIKRLEGIEASRSEIELAKNIVRIQENKKNIELLNTKNTQLGSKLNDCIEKSTTPTNNMAVDNVFEQFDSRCYIRSGRTPVYAPSKRQIKIGKDGYLYIGIGKIWYKSVNPLQKLTN